MRMRFSQSLENQTGPSDQMDKLLVMILAMDLRLMVLALLEEEVIS